MCGRCRPSRRLLCLPTRQDPLTASAPHDPDKYLEDATGELRVEVRPVDELPADLDALAADCLTTPDGAVGRSVLPHEDVQVGQNT